MCGCACLNIHVGVSIYVGVGGCVYICGWVGVSLDRRLCLYMCRYVDGRVYMWLGGCVYVCVGCHVEVPI